MANPCSNSDTKYHGNFDSNSSYDSMSHTYSDCINTPTFYSDWRVRHVGTAHNEYSKYDEIPPSGGNKHWMLHSWFSDIPDPMVDESCYDDCSYKYDCPTAYPDSALFEARHPDGYDDNDYELKDPQPDDTSSNGKADGIIDILLELAGGYAGGALGSAAGAAVGEFIDFSPSDPVRFDKLGSGSQQRWQWEIDMENSDLEDDFPQNKCGTSAVRFEVLNRMDKYDSSGNVNTGKLHTWSKQHFYVGQYHDGYYTGCPCGTGSTQIAYYSYETDWVFKDYIYKSQDTK
jgi:hypothetical protein